MHTKIKVIENLRVHLRKHIIGQDHIIDPWCNVIRKGHLGISNKKRPLGNFLLLGPTGTGKTELVLETANFLHQSQDKILRIDMSEYSSLAGDDVLKKMIGTPGAGGDIGLIGKFLEKTDRGIILYDELEKANEKLFTILLQQLDAARITLSNHKSYDLSKFYIVCTSNISAQMFQESSSISKRRQTEAALSELRAIFSPEFIARFGRINENILCFQKLRTEHLESIAIKFVNTEVERLQEHGLGKTNYSSNFINLALRQCNNTLNGAREIRNIIENQVQDAFINSVIRKSTNKGILCVDQQKKPYIRSN